MSKLSVAQQPPSQPRPQAPAPVQKVYAILAFIVNSEGHATCTDVYAPFAGDYDVLYNLLAQAQKLVAVQGEIAARNAQQAQAKPNRRIRRENAHA